MSFFFFFFQAEDGIRDLTVTGVQTCALPISRAAGFAGGRVPTTDPASGDAVVLDLPGRGPRAGDAPALLLAHHDTVHAVGAVPVRRDGDVLHGPGTYDMKGGG